MKQKLFLIILATICCESLFSQDTIWMCDRKSNYVYGSYWYDEYGKFCNGTTDFRHTWWHMRYGTPAIVVKHMVTDTPLYIIGVAAPVLITTEVSYYDTNRDPEYFYVYDLTDTGCTYLARTRWDTSQVHSYMEFVYGQQPVVNWGAGYPDTQRIYIPVYEAYFAKRVRVTDSFYVGGSTFNNMTSEIPGYTYVHATTNYVRWTVNQNTGNAIPELWNVMYTDKVKYFTPVDDTNFYLNHLLWPSVGCIFPIFDTLPVDTTTVQPDTCQPATGFRVLDLMDNNVVLTWDFEDNVQWELSLVKNDSLASPESGVVNAYTTNLASFNYLDTAFYTVYLRKVCEADNRSEWSQGITFTLPYTEEPPESIVSVIDRYTMLMPNPAEDQVTVFSSFHLRRIEIYTMEGKKVEGFDANGLSTTIDISRLVKGAYLLRITTPSGVSIKKMIKK